LKPEAVQFKKLLGGDITLLKGCSGDEGSAWVLNNLKLKVIYIY
jgi:hypothetical protein